MTTSTTSASGVGASSLTIGLGVLLSRVTGAGRILIGASIFGRSLLGDLFVAINVLPLALLSVFGGPAVTSVLVPPLVQLWDSSKERAEKLIARVLGLTVLSLGVMVVIFVLARGLIAELFVASVDDDRTNALEMASRLLAVMLPQLVLYGVVAVLVAAQHARGRFFIASIAPALENVIMILVLVLLSSRLDPADGFATSSTIWLLGIGSTLAVLAHVAVQWIGVLRCGVRLRMTLSRHGSDLRALLAPAAGSLGWTVSHAITRISVIVAAGFAGLGGVQSFEIAELIQAIPVAVVGYPIAAATLPRLADVGRSRADIADAMTVSAILASWVLVPIGTAMVVFARPLAKAITLGRFADPTSVDLTTFALAGLGIAAVASAWYEIVRQASMAARMYRSLNHSVAVALVMTLVGLAIAASVSTGNVLVLSIGGVVTLAGLVSLAVIARPLASLIRSERWQVVRRHGLRITFATAGTTLVTAGVHAAVTNQTDSAPLVLAVIGSCFVVCFVVLAMAATRRGALVRELIADLDASHR